MATVNYTILKDDKKQNGTWNVKIRVTQNNRSAYIETPHFVGKNQLDKKFKLKDTFLIDLINPVLAKYRAIISEYSTAQMTAKEIKELLSNVGNPKSDLIDFIEFSKYHIQKMTKAGKASSTKSLVTVTNSLIDFYQSERIPITEITSGSLYRYEEYLRSPRKFTRKNHDGKMLDYSKPAIGDSGLHNHMRDIRLLFNAARDHYNDEDKGIVKIAHYPFKKYKVGQAPETEKRCLTIEQIKSIRYCEVEPLSRAEQARDLFMLSFYLCGMNAADMYKLKAGLVERLEYNRSKTESRRKDKGFFSISIPDEAKPIYKKYAGNLQKRYSTTGGLLSAIDKGITKLIEQVGFEFDFYSARHSVGDLARNKLKFSKDDVAITLNHKDRTNSVTDIYISKDWSIVDDVQEKLIQLLNDQTT